MRRRIPILLIAILSCTRLGAGEFFDTAFPMLQRLNAAVAAYQNTDIQSSDYGAILCPGENLYHTRAAEAVFPLAYEYSKTGSKTRLQQAIILADWLISRQENEGQWKETPEEWTGTTTDQLLMLLLSYPLVEEKLSKLQKTAWVQAMRRAADYLTDNMDNNFASINYCATTSATLAQAFVLLGDTKYRDKSKELASMIISKMNYEFFIEGEGEKENSYKYGIDIGYNLEMSLWGLARYAQLLEDGEVWDAVCRSADKHLSFIYPNGILDASAGIRSNKWTLYGSGTSDGCHPLFVLMSERNPQFLTAAVRNINYFSTCFTSSGLLGPGPDYDKVLGTPPCIYPTFAKAKSLAMALSWIKKDTDNLPALDCDKDYSIYHQSIGTLISREGAFCSTITTYNYKAARGAGSKYMHRPTGGAVSLLWVEGYGVLQASSQSEYHRWEPMSFPLMPDIQPLTPMIRATDNQDTYSNLYEYDAIPSRSGEDCFVVHGQLRNRDQKRTGIAYAISYLFGKDTFTKHYELKRQSGNAEIEIIEPFVTDDATVFKRIDGHTIEFTRNHKTIRIYCGEAELLIDEARREQYKQVYPSLRAIPVIIRPQGPINLIYQTK